MVIIFICPEDTSQYQAQNPYLLTYKFYTYSRNEEREISTSGQDSATGTKKTLVLFIGGCTYAEISALRFLSQLEESNTEYLVATTSMINGNNFISGLTSELNDALSPF